MAEDEDSGLPLADFLVKHHITAEVVPLRDREALRIRSRRGTFLWPLPADHRSADDELLSVFGTFGGNAFELNETHYEFADWVDEYCVDTGYDTTDPESRRAFDHAIFLDDALRRLVGKAAAARLGDEVDWSSHVEWVLVDYETGERRPLTKAT